MAFSNPDVDVPSGGGIFADPPFQRIAGAGPPDFNANARRVVHLKEPKTFGPTAEDLLERQGPEGRQKVNHVPVVGGDIDGRFNPPSPLDVFDGERLGRRRERKLLNVFWHLGGLRFCRGAGNETTRYAAAMTERTMARGRIHLGMGILPTGERRMDFASALVPPSPMENPGPDHEAREKEIPQRFDDGSGPGGHRFQGAERRTFWRDGKIVSFLGQPLGQGQDEQGIAIRIGHLGIGEEGSSERDQFDVGRGAAGFRKVTVEPSQRPPGSGAQVFLPSRVDEFGGRVRLPLTLKARRIRVVKARPNPAVLGGPREPGEGQCGGRRKRWGEGTDERKSQNVQPAKRPVFLVEGVGQNEREIFHQKPRLPVLHGDVTALGVHNKIAFYLHPVMFQKRFQLRGLGDGPEILWENHPTVKRRHQGNAGRNVIVQDVQLFRRQGGLGAQKKEGVGFQSGVQFGKLYGLPAGTPQKDDPRGLL